MSNSLVSIVIPFYNNEKTILEAVKSVFSQTYMNWELILLNDGSKDNSLEIVQKINDPRVKIVSDGINRGLVYRLNQSPSLVKGDYIVRLDADDLMHPDRIAKQMSVFESNKDIDLVDAGTYSITELGEPDGLRGIQSINYNPKSIVSSAMLLHASIIGKKEWFENNKYDPDYIRAEDYELWIRTYQHSKFARIKEPLYIVREGKINVKNYIKGIRTVQKILRRYGPSILSKRELYFQLILAEMKIIIYSIFNVFNLQDFLSKKRNKPLTLEEKAELSLVLNKIRNIVLPN